MMCDSDSRPKTAENKIIDHRRQTRDYRKGNNIEWESLKSGVWSLILMANVWRPADLYDI